MVRATRGARNPDSELPNIAASGASGRGMSDFVEPRVRRVVAEFLGVGLEELTPEVSLVDELAVDSLDLVELAIALESDLGIIFPESAIDELRTYGDLVHT